MLLYKIKLVVNNERNNKHYARKNYSLINDK